MKWEKDLHKTRVFLKELAQEMGIGEDTERADRVLRAVLAVLRRRVSPQEFLDFIAQLPLCIKAEAVNGWDIDKFPDKSIKKLDDFIQAVIEEDKRLAHHDLGDAEQTKELVRKLFGYLKKHISEGEIKDLAAELPEEIKEFVLQA